MSPEKWRPFCPGRDELRYVTLKKSTNSLLLIYISPGQLWGEQYLQKVLCAHLTYPNWFKAGTTELEYFYRNSNNKIVSHQIFYTTPQIKKLLG